MHGIIIMGLKDYVVANYDWLTWRTIQDRADVERRLYTPVAQYPDRHGRELAAATRTLTGVDDEELAFDVGRHVVPTLLQVYGTHVGDVDSGLDVLSDAGGILARTLLREGLTGVALPDVAGERLDAETVRLRYDGAHCTGLRGVVAGLGEQYGETYAVTERACSHDGDDRCELVVSRAAATAEGEMAASGD